ncbi:MAG: nitroreductase family protein [Phycisphaerales bacterium]|nr:nitroreductase family protein [Hyphomonadaceae bacterium]
MTTRRHVLALLVSTPFAAACTPSGLPDPVSAWRAPGAGETDARRFCLAHAILAPNPHNRQPWLIDLVGDDELVFRADLERLLPATDPLNRQIVLGCGAFLEVFNLAARSLGRRAEITLWPEGEPDARLDDRPVAHIKLIGEEVEADPLFEHITRRRTNRDPYEARAVDGAMLTEVGEAALRPNPANTLAVYSVQGDTLRDDLRRLAWDAFEAEIKTPAAYQESVDLMRIGARQIAEHRDGLVMDGPMIEFAHAVGLLNHSVLADIEHPLVKQGYEAFRPLALEAPAFMWINSTNNSRTTQVEAGRAYARLNLAATRAGLAMHPWSQALQEYPEMAAMHARAEELMSAPSEARVQMFVRVGYGPQIGPAPRRGLSDHIRT